MSMSDTKKQVDTNKRKTLSTLLKVGVCAGVGAQASYIFSRSKTKIRVLGIHVTLQEELRKKPWKIWESN